MVGCAFWVRGIVVFLVHLRRGTKDERCLETNNRRVTCLSQTTCRAGSLQSRAVVLVRNRVRYSTSHPKPLNGSVSISVTVNSYSGACKEISQASTRVCAGLVGSRRSALWVEIRQSLSSHSFLPRENRYEHP